MTTTTANTLRNPFQNRFHDPVTRRQDEMQSGAYVTVLRDRDLKSANNSAPSHSAENTSSTASHQNQS